MNKKINDDSFQSFKFQNVNISHLYGWYLDENKPLLTSGYPIQYKDDTLPV